MDLKKAVSKIKRFISQNQRVPSYREIAKLMGYASKNAAYYLVEKLIEADFLQKDKKGKLVPKNILAIPHLGLIKAGYPDESQEPEKQLFLKKHLVPHPERSWALGVSGDSMIEAGIMPGDTVILQKEAEFKNGDIVAAQIDGEFTLKYWYQENGRVKLRAANSKYPELVPKTNLKIFGKVVSVLRRY